MRTIIAVGILYLAPLINFDIYRAMPFPWFILIIAAIGDITQYIQRVKDLSE